MLLSDKRILEEMEKENIVIEPFEMRQLEPMMSAFAGRIETTSEAVVWSYKR